MGAREVRGNGGSTRYAWEPASGGSSPLEPLAPDVCVAGEVGVRFVRGGGARVNGFVVGNERARGIRCDRR